MLDKLPRSLTTWAVTALCLLAPASAVSAQAQPDEVSRTLALLRKGRPAHLSAEEWREIRLGVMAGLAQEPSAGRDAIAFLAESLADPDLELAAAAAGSLLVLDPDGAGRRATAALARVLKEGPVPARALAARQLRLVRPDAIQAVVPALASALSDRDVEVRITAIETLGTFETLADGAVPALRRLLTGSDRRTADAVAAALESIEEPQDPPLDAIPIQADRPSRWSRVVPESDLDTAVRQFQSADPELRNKGLASIEAHREKAAAAVPALIAALTDKDLSFRYRVAYALTTVDPGRAERALPVLREMMRSDVLIPGSSPRILASIGLGRLARAGADALVEALGDRAPETRQAAALALMDSDEFPPAAVPALVRGARDPDESVRLQSMSTLISREAEASIVVPLLVEALDDTSPRIRASAASGLSHHAGVARRAIPKLTAMTRERDATVAISAQAALAWIDPDNAVRLLPFFIATLSGPSPGNFAIGRAGDDLDGPIRRLHAMGAIEALGPRAAAALPVLRRIWRREERLFQLSAGMAIVSVDPGTTPQLVNAFIKGLGDEDDGETHYSLLLRLQQLGPRAAAAERAIERLLTRDDPALRQLAAETLAAVRKR